jgi:hypothetical protein
MLVDPLGATATVYPHDRFTMRPIVRWQASWGISAISNLSSAPESGALAILTGVTLTSARLFLKPET